MALNDNLLAAVIAHKVDLLRFTETVRKKILDLLIAVGQEIQDSINDEDLAEIKNLTKRRARQEKLITQLAGTVATAYRTASTVLDSQLLELADLTQKFGVNLLNKGFESRIASVALTRNDLKSLASNIMVQGAVTKDWWNKQSVDLQHRFAQQIRLGLAQGETNAQLVRRIRGSYDGTKSVIELPDGTTRTVRNFSGGIMATSEREATALVRTAVQSISNDVLNTVYNENVDVLNGRMWISTLDTRTSQICRTYDKACFDFDNKPIPPTKLPYHSIPAHFQCRSVWVPLTKSWDELIADAGGKPKGPIKEVPPSVRASMDGEVPAGLTYEDWLKKQSVARQKQVLGEGKWQLWSKGKLSFAEMIDQSGNPLTLEQLKDKVNND